MQPTIQNIAVLGAGSAGLIAALALRRMIPSLRVRVIRSPDIGVIGVGEGSTPYLRSFLLDFLRLDPDRFYAEAQPTWKLGIQLHWGSRKSFNYSFAEQTALRIRGFQRPMGFYCEDDFELLNLDSAMMAINRVAARDQKGWPVFSPTHAWHIENRRFVGWLELEARKAGVEITDATLANVELVAPGHVAALQLDTGERVAADLFIDASGFRSELLGRSLGETWVSYNDALLCDRAIVGGWERAEEPILPYTIAETMDAGWCWRIDHEHLINRGYVFSSQFVSDDDARVEFLRKNPKAPSDGRVIKFRSGRFARPWVGNVVGIGNAAGFVEPLEATALMLIATEARALIDTLVETRLKPTPTAVALFNRWNTAMWDTTRDFLAVHYRFNTRLDTPFWQHVRAATPLGMAEPLIAFYQENGPSLLSSDLFPTGIPAFGLEGFLTILVGQKVPTQARHDPTPQERELLSKRRAFLSDQANAGVTARVALDLVRNKGWCWNKP